MDALRDHDAGGQGYLEGGIGGAALVGYRNRHLCALFEFVCAKGHLLGEVVVGPVAASAHGDHGPGPDQQGQTRCFVTFLDPTRPLQRGPADQLRPAPGRQVVRDIAVFGEYRRHQERLAQHVLPVQERGGWIVWELQQHGPHHRHAVLPHIHGRPIEIGHEAALEVREISDDLDRIIVDQPGDAVRVAAVEAAVRAKQTELGPALVDGRRGRPFEATDIVAPEAEAGHSEGEAAPQGVGHRGEGALAVAAPVDREQPAASRRRPGEDNRLAVAAPLAEQFENRLVVEVGVEVVHPLRV